MNKLLLVGNGFDLAHGLPTSYRDFLNDFWKNFSKNYNNQEVKNLIAIDDQYNDYFNNGNNTIERFDDLALNLKNYCKNDNYIFEEKDFIARDKLKNIFKFKNDFFKIINLKNSIEDWVDIENEYYLQLKRIAKLKFGNFTEEETKKETRKKILKLNIEFESVKILLKNYLIGKVNQIYDFTQIEESKELTKIFRNI
ncbi:AbiH family protein [Polaribacter glomeratus]|uniref:Bacteriophage abortive infection AbiH n=1 Tax=Polaribacter glomeratus TaxID=102 RepID=A0A2S7WGJ2_9FLAO|nr:AbiH family protein [Polaribacter glomeratus]PQJ76728.1 hypothetical protein BTO16_12670 [Polaribacter glomeratus]TXD67430.1 hypothetical protein ESX12_02245 [Polaribacter glomeratus]